MYWLLENLPFLYRTDESFQLTSKPASYAVSFDAKYLFVPVSANTGKIAVQLTTEQELLLKSFRQLDQHTKAQLASYSYSLHRQNLYWWNIWLHYPLSEQIRTAVTLRQNGG
jgi:DNA-binding beta-propeller fold protein YncE